MERKRFECKKCGVVFWAVRTEGAWHRPPSFCTACARSAVTWHGGGARVRRACLKCSDTFFVFRKRLLPSDAANLPIYCPPCRMIRNPYGRQRYVKDG